MASTKVIATRTISLVLAFATVVSTSAVASTVPHFTIVAEQKTKAQMVTIHVRNPKDEVRDILVDGHLYTVKAHDTLTIQAAAGTAVYAASTDDDHQKGNLLFSLTMQMKNATVSLD